MKDHRQGWSLGDVGDACVMKWSKNPCNMGDRLLSAEGTTEIIFRPFWAWLGDIADSRGFNPACGLISPSGFLLVAISQTTTKGKTNRPFGSSNAEEGAPQAETVSRCMLHPTEERAPSA